MGLAIIFVYAFFKFGWSYRLYNYVAIMVGATPPAKDKDTPEAKAHAERVGRLCEVAGRPFNRGQRAFFFALGGRGGAVAMAVRLGFPPRAVRRRLKRQRRNSRTVSAELIATPSAVPAPTINCCSRSCIARASCASISSSMESSVAWRAATVMSSDMHSPYPFPYTRSHSESFFRFVNSRTARARIHQIFVLADSSGELRN